MKSIPTLLCYALNYISLNVAVFVVSAYAIFNWSQYFQENSITANITALVFFLVMTLFLKKQLTSHLKVFNKVTKKTNNCFSTAESNLKPRDFKYNFELENNQQVAPRNTSFPDSISAASKSIDTNEEEIQLIHSLDSDWSCNRREKCLLSIEGISKKYDIMKVIKIYFTTGKAQNPALLAVTFKLLSECSPLQRDWHLSWLISAYPINFTVRQLRAMMRQIGNYQDLSKQSPLLIVYLAGQYDKYKFYLKLGYSDQIAYRSTVFSNIGSGEAATHILTKNLPNQKYLGMTLAQVTNLERPKAIQQKFKIVN